MRQAFSNSCFRRRISWFETRAFVWLAAALAATSLAAYASEPEHDGQSLSGWLEQLQSVKTDTERTQARTAIRAIGTNGLPALLAWLRYEPSQLKTDAVEFLARLRASSYGRWIPAELTYDHTRVPPANLGFHMLGPEAAEAIPELERMANHAANPRPAARAMVALMAIGPKAMPAIEARLSNSNFPMSPESAVRIYICTRTLTNQQSITTEVARPILLELQTNTNPILARGATDVLKLMDLPSPFEKKRNKSLSEALLDLGMERQMGSSLRPGWNLPTAATRSNRIVALTTNSITGVVLPPMPHDDEPYPYPLLPGSQAWMDADLSEQIESTKIPKAWRERATSWQMFRSAITHPHFRGIYSPGYDLADCYRASRNGMVSILQEVDTSPDFGTNILRWLTELDLGKMVSSDCSTEEQPCWMEYLVVWYMAGLDSALETLDRDGRQRLFKLAVWDADYLLSKSEEFVASGPVGLMYIIYNKPESLRGAFPSGFMLPRRSSSPEHIRLAVSNAKAAYKLTRRPR